MTTEEKQRTPEPMAAQDVQEKQQTPEQLERQRQWDEEFGKRRPRQPGDPNGAKRLLLAMVLAAIICVALSYALKY